MLCNENDFKIIAKICFNDITQPRLVESNFTLCFYSKLLYSRVNTWMSQTQTLNYQKHDDVLVVNTILCGFRSDEQQKQQKIGQTRYFANQLRWIFWGDWKFFFRVCWLKKKFIDVKILLKIIKWWGKLSFGIWVILM